MIQSESTRVPPVTAERSPPASRMTGADSPVIADSSTDATPSMISPSPGMTSPADTRTTSPLQQLRRRHPFDRARRSTTRLASVSVFARRSVSAWALPRPSAMASAKLANSTVSHSHDDDLHLRTADRHGRVTASIANRAGHQHGADLDDEHDRVARHRERIQLPERVDAARAGRARDPRWPRRSCAWLAMAQNTFPCRSSSCFDDRPEAERGEERQRADDDDDADEQRREQRRRHRERAERRRRRVFLRARLPASASIGMIAMNRPRSIAMPSVVLYQGVFAERPAKAEPLLPVPDV